MKIVTVTPPAYEPVTLDEAKQWARVDFDDDDTLITALIAAAREAAESFTKRAFITQTLKLTLDLPCRNVPWVDGFYDMPESALTGGLPKVVELPRPPVSAITSVMTYDTANASATYSNTNYILNNNRLVLSDTAYWPSGLRPVGTCEITYTAGYGTPSDVPEAIKTAIKMHVQTMYDERIVCEMPASCQQLLRQFKVYGLR